jgi:hypothetical protein
MLKVADECWIALARLHREDPSRPGFLPAEILRRVKADAIGPVRPGIQPHIVQHNVANAKPSPAQYRMFFRLPTGELRLFRPADRAHPERKGKTRPDPNELPDAMHDLIDWYDNEYCRQSAPAEMDPVLAMIGAGKELWADEDGDTFIRRLRREEDWKHASVPDLADSLWRRLLVHEGETFHTVKGLPFRYFVTGNGILFERDGRLIDKRLGRADFEKAAARLPLRKVADIRDCFDPSYLYALLTDSRIVRQPDLAA